MFSDFHTHSFLSDGALLPIELIRRAAARGCAALAITDHVSRGNLASIVDALIAECELAEEHWDLRAIAGVEITHVPPEVIPSLAGEARRRGADLVLVHGETLVEPVPPGTNLAALRCPDVDILAHPGPIDVELAGLAARNEVFLEISAHQGHCLGNGGVAQAAREAGALLLVNSDAHVPDEILTEDFARRVASGAGLSDEEIEAALVANPKRLIDRIDARARARRTP